MKRIELIESGVVFNEFYDIIDRFDSFDRFIRNLDFKFIFNRHHKIDYIERIRAQIIRN